MILLLKEIINVFFYIENAYKNIGFYFKVSNTRKNSLITFHIINFVFFIKYNEI